MLRRLQLILRFYRSSMLFFCGLTSAALAWVVTEAPPSIVPWLLLGKLAIYLPLLYVWVVPVYSDEFFYYRNLGVRRRWLLGGSCAVDFLLCWLLLRLIPVVL